MAAIAISCDSALSDQPRHGLEVPDYGTDLTKFPLAGQRARSHQEFIDGAGALAAFADRPDHQRLASAHIARGEYFGLGSTIVHGVGFHIAAWVEGDPGLLD